MDSTHAMRPRLSLSQARQRTNGHAESAPVLVSGCRHHPRRPGGIFLRTLDRRKSAQSDSDCQRHDRNRPADVVRGIFRPAQSPHRTNFSRPFARYRHLAGPRAFSRGPLLVPAFDATNRRSRGQRSPETPQATSRRSARHPAIHPNCQHRGLHRSRLHRHSLLPEVFADTHTENLYLLPDCLWYSHFVARVPPLGFCALAPALPRFSTRRPSPIFAQSLLLSQRTPHSGILRRPIAAKSRALAV